MWSESIAIFDPYNSILGEENMSIRDKLKANSEPIDLFPELSPMRKAWNRFVVWLYNMIWRC